jgi:hypothetical protein
MMILADKNPAVTNAIDLFDRINVRTTPLRFRRGNKKPRLRTGHFQGIQQLRTAPNQTRYYAMTRNSWSGPFLIVVAFPTDQLHKGEIVAKHLLHSDGRKRPLKHPGGFQIIGDYAVIGVEDESGKKRSQIQFWDLSNPLNPRPASHLTIKREGTVKGNKTAGAVGICSRENDHLMVVGSWGSKQLDFYSSNGKPLSNDKCDFTYLATWDSETASKTGWIDGQWGNHQNLNLVTDSNGAIYLIGFHRGGGHDYADLFELSFAGEVTLKKVASKHLILTNRCTFQHAGGAYLEPNRLTILAGPKDLGRSEMYLNIAE